MKLRTNVLDKFISIFSPSTALKRAYDRTRYDVFASGYSEHGANDSKRTMRGWRLSGGSPDDDITANIQNLRVKCRDMYMGIPLATGALKTAKTNVVGFGLQPNLQIDTEFLGMTDEEGDRWERKVKREFLLWAESKNCDAARRCDFYQLQQLAFLSALMSGDVFVGLPMIKRQGEVYDLRINLIEADRVCNPYTIPETSAIMEGVEVGEYGDPIAYYVAKHHPLSHVNMKINEWQKIAAFGSKTGRKNILHLYEMERPGQRRGVPFLTPVIETLKQLGRYIDAEIMAAVITGCFTVFITSEAPEGVNVGENNIPGLVDEAEPDNQDIYLGHGNVVDLLPGEKPEFINPNRPNTAFDPFVLAVLRQIGSALEIPMELLVKHFTASYSASRAALLEAWKFFRTRRAWLTSDFCQPIYEQWLTEAVLRGRVYAPGFLDDPAIRAAYCSAEWNGPSPGQLDPLKEAQAEVLKVAHCFSTSEKSTAELTGSDWNKNCRQRIKEEKVMKEGGLRDDE